MQRTHITHTHTYEYMHKFMPPTHMSHTHTRTHTHADVQQMLIQGIAWPSGHQPVHADLRTASGGFDGESDHEDIDQYFANKKTDYDAGDHPNINDWMEYAPVQFTPYRCVYVCV